MNSSRHYVTNAHLLGMLIIFISQRQYGWPRKVLLQTRRRTWEKQRRLILPNLECEVLEIKVHRTLLTSSTSKLEGVAHKAGFEPTNKSSAHPPLHQKGWSKIPGKDGPCLCC